TEHGHGSDPGGMETRAERDGDHYILNGSKCWIGNATIADVKVVWAKDDAGHVGGFVVEKDTPGFRARDIEGKFSLRMSRTSECWFENCRIPAENRLPNASGLRAPLSCLSYVRVGIGGASLARRLIATKQRWRTPKHANNSAAQLAVSNSCNKNLSGWRRKSPRRSYWRSVLRASWRQVHRVLRRSQWRNATMSGWPCNVRTKRGTFLALQESPINIPQFGIL